jgi:hypothetical protein
VPFLLVPLLLWALPARTKSSSASVPPPASSGGGYGDMSPPRSNDAVDSPLANWSHGSLPAHVGAAADMSLIFERAITDGRSLSSDQHNGAGTVQPRPAPYTPPRFAPDGGSAAGEAAARRFGSDVASPSGQRVRSLALAALDRSPAEPARTTACLSV